MQKSYCGCWDDNWKAGLTQAVPVLHWEQQGLGIYVPLQTPVRTAPVLKALFKNKDTFIVWQYSMFRKDGKYKAIFEEKRSPKQKGKSGQSSNKLTTGIFWNYSLSSHLAKTLEKSFFWLLQAALKTFLLGLSVKPAN